ncbi:hypothetical protein WIS52_21765 [Pseudonocardia nematodicida]|uniref:Phosphotransferase enzyme family protein n=1 Tax=Pseudonocardia nematodicida TaxID=1206997 RepID=A0ABV1KFI5_9PSEU
MSAPVDAALPGAATILDPAARDRLLARHGAGDPVALRLRWKPGTNLRLGVVGTRRSLLVASFADAGKADALARRPGAVRDATGLVVLDAVRDPALRLRGAEPVPGMSVLAYNPDRRIVLRSGDEVLKRHAAPPPRAVLDLLTDPPGPLAPHLPGTVVHGTGRSVRSSWVDGRAPGPDDGDAVRDALAALRSCVPPAGLPVLRGGDVHAAAAAAVAALTRILPDSAARTRPALDVLRRAPWPDPVEPVHGDLSVDQVVVDGDRAVLLDLDRAAVGPPGWDAAQWTAAALTGPGPAWPGPEPDPVLLLAALLQRLPEPFKRLRDGWEADTGRLLDAVEETAARVADRSDPAPPADRALRRLPSGLRTARAWPIDRPGSRAPVLAVEATAADGRVVGVLLPVRLRRPVEVLDGADPALPDLAPALARPGAVLLGHRPGKRAVLRDGDGGYLKVVRPGRAGRVVAVLDTAREKVRGRPGAPVIPDAVPLTDGTVRLAPLSGPSLHALLARDPGGRAAEACAGLVGALAALRDADPSGLAVHTGGDEAAVLTRWAADADRLTGSSLSGPARAVAAALAALGPRPAVPCHRDLHDKQVIALSGGRTGLLDLDTLCAADPALDAGNLLAHLRLRAEQGHTSAGRARECAAALGLPDPYSAVPGGRPDGHALAVYTAAALLRVAAVHRFRPEPARLTGRLVAAAREVAPGPPRLAAWRA